MSKVSCEKVVSVLEVFGLQSKPPEMINDCRVLGLRVHKFGHSYQWGRDNKLPDISDDETRRDLFFLCGVMRVR